jgi:signal transduction histidine kinase/streptogramin lyase
VQSICEDASKVLWATTENGLVIVRKHEKWTPVRPGAEWSGARATCVAADACGTVWIGTRRRQLIRYRDGRFTSLPIPSQIIHALLVETNGDLWIGGEVPENLLRLHEGNLQTKTLPPGIRIIRGMAEDSTGNLWLGTSKGMLLKVNGDQVTDETVRTTGTPLSIRGLQTTSDGSLWIAYVGGGVGWLKGERFLRIDMAKGLYDDIVSQIVGDDQGCLWFGCDHGIFKVARQEFDDLAAGRIERVHSIHYGRDHGLVSLQANFGDAPGAIHSQDGRLWLPLRTGVAVVEPQRLRQDLQPPTGLLKRIVVDDQIIAYYGGVVPVSEIVDLQHARNRLRLMPGHHRLQFDFAALSPGTAENVCFRYRMDGIDDRWIEADSQRSATYSRLAAGNYQFHVTACNANGIWNSNDATFAFTVAPFFWQSWWFRLASLTLFTSGAVGIARYVSFRRLRLQLRELEQKAALDRERARIAKDIHDDVGGSLTQTVLLLNLSRKNQTDSRKLNDYFGQISSGIRKVVESLDEIVWAVNPGNDQLPHVVDYMAQFAADFLRAANLRFHLDFPDNPPNRLLAPEVRHNLFLVLKEALNNVVRHAAASEVQVCFKATEDAINLIVEDNGRGFNGEWKSVGADGLRNMRQRMNDIGGNCVIESRSGTGTRVAAFFPWSASNGLVASPEHATN